MDTIEKSNVMVYQLWEELSVLNNFIQNNIFGNTQQANLSFQSIRQNYKNIL